MKFTGFVLHPRHSVRPEEPAEDPWPLPCLQAVLIRHGLLVLLFGLGFQRVTRGSGAQFSKAAVFSPVSPTQT